jgi:hypothetical protein
MKNIILFGAGASYGSDNSGIPPLGNNLFSELARFNPPGWGSLSIEYKNTFNDDFEQGMLKVASERPYDLTTFPFCKGQCPLTFLTFSLGILIYISNSQIS